MAVRRRLNLTRASVAGSGLSASTSRSSAQTAFGPVARSLSPGPSGQTASGGASIRSPRASIKPAPRSTRSLSRTSPCTVATTAVRMVPSYRARSTSAYTRSKRSSGNWKSVASS